MTPLIGRCLCGKVEFKILSKPVSQGVCYCIPCQKTGGVLGSPLLVLNKKAFDCTLESLSFFSSASERGSTVCRHFCKYCGTHVFSTISDAPDILTVKVAALDERESFVPDYLVWTKRANPQCIFPRDVPSFLENAPFELLLKGQAT
jgi:hypothetical protein